jgi:hypothetical protein
MTGSSMQLEAIVTTFAWDDAIEDLYTSWRDQVRRAGYAHEVLQRRLGVRWVVVGVVVVLAAACAAAIVLAPLLAPGAYARVTRGIDPDAMAIAVASLAAAAAILAILQVAAPSAVRAERHRAAAFRYRSLDRAMAAMLALPREARPSPDAALAWVRERLTRYERQSPAVAPRQREKLDASFEASIAAVDPVPLTPRVPDTRSVAAT